MLVKHSLRVARALLRLSFTAFSILAIALCVYGAGSPEVVANTCTTEITQPGHALVRLNVPCTFQWPPKDSLGVIFHLVVQGVSPAQLDDAAPLMSLPEPLDFSGEPEL